MTRLSREEYKHLDYIVVGSGFFGATMAEQISRRLGRKVLVLEKRSHIGGNCYSEIDPATGVECHIYGSHIFHTKEREVWDYIRKFSGFNHYRHKVLTTFENRVYPMPINLETINKFFDLCLKPAEVEAFLKKEAGRAGISRPRNFEEKAVSLVGRPLYEAFLKGYTIKQWGTSPDDLPADILNRIPVRTNYHDAYFDDPYQGIPSKGYTAVFKEMLKNDNIIVQTDTDFFDIRAELNPEAVIIYSGPIDRFFNYRHGELGWRTVEFEKQSLVQTPDFQGTAVMNYADPDIPFTRIHEFKHFHPERKPLAGTTIYREFSKGVSKKDDPYYPIHTARDKEILSLYQKLAEQTPGVIFGGRLGSYAYLDMDQTIQKALQLFKTKLLNQ
jgi:UDP-galactopyranose mutase